MQLDVWNKIQPIMSEAAEKGFTPGNDQKGDIIAPEYSGSESPTRGQHKTVADAVLEEPFMTRMGLTLDSFKPRQYGRGIVELERSMKSRHLHMIAIGGSIGAGFFVGSGSALSNGGPGSLLIDFLIIGIMMFNVVYALGELAVMYPVSGGFYTYSTRFIDPSWGFAMVSSFFAPGRDRWWDSEHCRFWDANRAIRQDCGNRAKRCRSSSKRPCHVYHVLASS